MAKRMTVVFYDEELYTALKVEAARRGCPAKDIVAGAVREWLGAREASKPKSSSSRPQPSKSVKQYYTRWSLPQQPSET